MAAQASSFDGDRSRAGWTDAARHAGAGEKAGSYRLPPVPNQEIYFYRKPIDNSRVVRQDDPRARARCWRWIATATAATFLLAGLLWPSAYGMLAGYQVESLKAGEQTLRAELASLEAEAASLLSPERLDEMALEQELIDPAPDQIVHLPPAPDGSLARNMKSK